MTALSGLEYIKLGIYYASYLYFLAAPLALWLMVKSSWRLRGALAFFLAIISALAYGRFVEPRVLITNEHEVALSKCFAEEGAARIAVFSDTHNGLFKNAMPIDRIAAAVNEADADFVLIPGDFVYFLHPDRFDETFSAFSSIKAPVYAVLGNHDLGIPGPDLSAPLLQALSTLDVTFIDDSVEALEIGGGAIELVGLSERWAQNQNFALVERETDKPRIVLTHNPATVEDFWLERAPRPLLRGKARRGLEGYEASISDEERSSRIPRKTDLLVSGHTHGGQIQLPFLTCFLTGVCGEAAYGLRHQNHTLIFTTSGTGMVGLPMRFRVPPRIDVLNVRYSACATG